MEGKHCQGKHHRGVRPCGVPCWPSPLPPHGGVVFHALEQGRSTLEPSPSPSHLPPPCIALVRLPSLCHTASQCQVAVPRRHRGESIERGEGAEQCVCVCGGGRVC